MAQPLALATRRLEPEVMDQPQLDGVLHHAALRGLSRINRWSASAGVQWAALQSLMRDRGLTSLRVLDIATGGGDVPVHVWRKARLAGADVRFEACDASARAVHYARERARRRHADVTFFPLNALEDPLPDRYDVITCWLFLHHLREDAAVGLLRSMAQAARHMVLVDDLTRGLPGMAVAYAGTRLLSRSPVVHVDGLRSVAAAFTMDEAAGLARTAGLDGFTINAHWPFRYLLSWRRV